MHRNIYTHKRTITALLFLLFIFLIIPSPKFDAPSSTVIQSAEGELLGARIAADEQWRFALIDSVPEKFEICITQFEDQWFRYHPGFNPISMARALWQNLKAGHIVSGGSTLTMQTVRMARQGKELRKPARHHRIVGCSFREKSLRKKPECQVLMC